MVRTATYRPGIDQSQHVKSVSHTCIIMKSMAFIKFLKTENLTKNIWEFYIGQALMPVQPYNNEMYG